MLSGVNSFEVQSVEEAELGQPNEDPRSSSQLRMGAKRGQLSNSQTLLSENYTSRLVADVHGSSVPSEHTALHVSINNNNSAILLQAHSDHAAVIADRKLARNHATRGEFLDLGEVAVGVVDAEVD